MQFFLKPIGREQVTLLALLLFPLFVPFGLSAQRLARGTVMDAETGDPLENVKVEVERKSKSVITGENGAFVIDLKANETTLILSLPGYRPTEIEATFAPVLNVLLEKDVSDATKVLATALGVMQERKKLGYAVQDISTRSLSQAREVNFLNTLSAKIAGLNIVGNATGIGGSARINLRGDRSLNLNNNAPLFVLDGIPISNQSFGAARGLYQEIDFGNAAGMINPDDIESISILKGLAGAALYGSRANNGAVLLTSKSGKGTRGIGVTVNSSLMVQGLLRLPNYQNRYGQGLEGVFEFKDGLGGGINDGVDENWGPAFEGQSIRQFDAATANGFRGGEIGNLFPALGAVDLEAQLEARGAVDSTAWTAQPDNIRDFFETGLTFQQHLAMAGSHEKGAFRLGYTFLDQKGIIPNTHLNRHTLSFAGNYQLHKKLQTQAVVHYFKNNSDNLPSLGTGADNIMYLFNGGLGRQIGMGALRNYWQTGLEGTNQFNFNYNAHNNPYFTVFENTNNQAQDRILSNAAVKYYFKDWLWLQLRAGWDISTEFRSASRTFSHIAFPRGSYRESNLFFEEVNSDILLNATRDLSEKVSLSAMVGGNLMRQRLRISDSNAPELAAPGIYTLSNATRPLESYTFRSEKQIQSVYATSQFTFNDFLHINLVARNDWSSTLPSSDRSMLSYAANASLVFTNAPKNKGKSRNNFLSFGQLRAAYAHTGSDPEPYQLTTVYDVQTPVRGLLNFSESNVLTNDALTPELNQTIEGGISLWFLNNHFGLDVSYFTTTTDNQILSIPLSSATTYRARILNAGKVKSNGIEAIVTLLPIRKQHFKWDIGINFSTYRSEVLELFADSTSSQAYIMADRFVTIEARKGERVGNIYGITYQRTNADPNSPYYDASGQYIGQVVFNKEGKPIPAATPELLGNINPDWQAGISNTITYKNITFSFLFDLRFGGKLYAHTQTLGIGKGQLEESLEGRANGYDLTQDGNGMVGQGVMFSDTAGIVPNTIKISAREWHQSYTLGRFIPESLVYDASFIKLREARISYTLGSVQLGKLKVRDMTFSVVGRNLLLLTDVPNIDPETLTLAGNTLIPGIETLSIPSTRSIGLNVYFRF